MKWNWELPEWPYFQYDLTKNASIEKEFLQGSGGTFAVMKHLNEDGRKGLIIEVLSTEGEKSAEIEGEVLERESLQSSIKKCFGLKGGKGKESPKEKGMAKLLWQMYTTYDEPLTHQMLFEWHRLLMSGENAIADKGKYRTHEEPMQIVSNRSDKQRVYFEAPPSRKVQYEMEQFIQWFNHSREDISILVRASIAHVYFESIHPFEDGNGRIGRALVEKVLSQGLKHSSLVALSQVIYQRRKEYYQMLGSCNRSLNAQGWVTFFSNVIVEAQKEALKQVHFLMMKSTIMNELKGTINTRQEKVLLRIFREGPKGFDGGLSAENYIKITKTSRATATRDLNDLVQKGVLRKTGSLRHTRYWIQELIS